MAAISSTSRPTQVLVRQLVQRVAAKPFPAVSRKGSSDRAPDVILDMEVDGVRCLLVRAQPEALSHGIICLSPREEEIARMVAKGHPSKTIAAVLEISPWTVCTHLRRIFGKLGVRSRAAMVARIIEEDLLREWSPVGNTNAGREAGGRGVGAHREGRPARPTPDTVR